VTDKDGKVEIKIGNLSFSAEGSQTWLAEQLEKMIAAAANIPSVSAGVGQSPEASVGAGSASATVPTGDSLNSYLKAKGGDSKQVIRFLATANWLRRRGTKDLSASSIAKTLAEHHQKKLANPADCLNQNVSKGYCEKTGSTFFITPEGLSSLGEAP
jgi:hypothetical protein